MANNITLNDENDLYSVLPLGDGMIRVIDVHQNHTGHSATTSTLSGQLRALALSDKPKFVALSYFWGSRGRDESPYNIQLYAFEGSVTLKISETAYQAIRDVRNHHKGQLTLWIDTICINQNDNSEKEMQIPLMREIYSNAEIVYVHLGRTDSTDVALDWMTYISQRRYRGTGILGPGGEDAAKWSVYILLLINFWTVITRYLYLAELLATPIFLLLRACFIPLFSRMGTADLDARKLRSINSLLKHPWIQRAWTWQELVLARKAVVICGSKALSWDRFLLALSVLELCSHKVEKRSCGHVPLPRGATVGTLVATSRAYRKTDRRFPENPGLGNLKIWCFLAECWLRFGRSLTMSGEVAGKRPKTFLDYHFKLYSVGTIIVTCLLVLPLLAAIAVAIYVIQSFFFFCPEGYACIAPSPLTLCILFVAIIINSFLVKYSINILRDLRRDVKNYCRLPIVFAIVPVLRTREATDPKDICYGFYGVLQEEGLTNLPSADYQRDSRIVFREFLVSLIQWDSRALVLLLDCCNYAEPSWSPDWRVSSRQSWLDEVYFFGNSAISATPTSVPYFDMTDDELGLFVYGKQVGQDGVVWTEANVVVNDLPLANAEKNADTRSLAVLLEWIRTGLRPRSGQATNISLEDRVEIFEALEKDVTKAFPTESYRIKALARLSNGFTSWLNVIEPYVVGSETQGTEITVQQDADSSRIPSGNPESIVRCYEALLASERALEYHRKIRNSIAHQQRLFIHPGPDRFRFGAGSLATEVGDIVCLISGLPVPMILRKAGDPRQFTRDGCEHSAQAFLVVGPAFIPGIMKGEMWPRGKNTQPLPRDRMKQFFLV